MADSQPLGISPAPLSSPIICGLQRQSEGTSRGFRPEGTNDWLMITTLAGTGYVRANAGKWSIVRGDILLIAPGTSQEYGHLDEDSGWINIWVHFRPRAQWINWLNWPPLSRGIMLLRTGDRFADIEPELRRMVDVSSGPLRLRLEAAMNALERVLLACDDANPAHGISERDGRIRKALEIIGERLAEPLSVAALSKAVGLSRSRFSVLFSEQMSLSPQSYIEATRLARAAQMLQSSSWPVTQIAEEVGFPNAYYFSTRFRRQFGVPPSAYRAGRKDTPS